MKKRLLFIGILFAMLLGCLFAGCASADPGEGRVKVTYMLEGGTYRNGSEVVQYYSYPAGKNLLREIGTDSGKEPERAGYRLEGWYRTRTGSGEDVIYSDKWDFSSDTLNGEPVTLYAKWVRLVRHVFELHYFDGENNDVVQGEVEVNEGESFEANLDWAKRAAARSGYTILGWTDEKGDPFDLATVHPGGEESYAYPVYVRYIEGNYTVVSTAAELKAASSKSIYLAADVDLGGEEFSFGDYRMRTLNGAGHTISNFKLKVQLDKNALIDDYEESGKKSVAASLFGSAYGSTVFDVSFVYTVELKTKYSGISGNIYLAALSSSSQKATFRNVRVTASYQYELDALPNGFTDERVKVETEKGYVVKDAESRFEEVEISLTRVTAE